MKKFCKDCRHFINALPLDLCGHPKNAGDPDPVRGHVPRICCAQARREPENCGPDGRWWEEQGRKPLWRRILDAQ